MAKPEYEKSNALASLGGYASQMMWALLALIKSTDKASRVGIEVIDDVTIEQNGSATLQQTKKSINPEQSPFTDLNLNLWKTFAIWISYVEEKDANCECTQFHLVTNAVVKPAHLVSLLKGEASAEKIDTYIEEVRKLYDSCESVDVKKKIEKCISVESIESFKKILLNCTLMDGSMSSGAIMEDIANHVGIPANANSEDFMDKIVGWFVNSVMKKLELNEDIWVNRADYIQANAAAVISCAGPKVIGSSQADLEMSKEYQDSAGDSTYIKQLRLIEISAENEIEGAMHDYFRFCRTRDQTIDNSEVLASEWEKDTRRLKEFWQQTNQIDVRNAAQDVASCKIGQGIYDKCRMYDALPPLNGNAREAFVIRGHYHVLADEESIWWHPDYQDVKG